MGYNTNFSGVLLFANPLTIPQLVALEEILGEDRRDHPEWQAPDTFYYIDLQITRLKDGLEWNEAEKTYGMVDIVNTIIREMRKQWPNFGLHGELLAEGEELTDRYRVVIGDDGFAHKVPVAIPEQIITCPHCHKEFLV